MYFDHKNIERAESVLASRRASENMVNWIADTQHLLANVVRVWIDGKLNVLADVGSRLPWHFVVAKHLPFPHKPMLDIIRDLFASPEELAKETAKRYADMDSGPWDFHALDPTPSAFRMA